MTPQENPFESQINSLNKQVAILQSQLGKNQHTTQLNNLNMQVEALQTKIKAMEQSLERFEKRLQGNIYALLSGILIFSVLIVLTALSK